jgi:HEAT repeat protein
LQKISLSTLSKPFLKFNGRPDDKPAPFWIAPASGRIVYTGNRGEGEKRMLHHCKKILSHTSLCLLVTAILVAPSKVSAGDDLDGIRTQLAKGDWKTRLSAVEKLENRRDEGALDMLRKVASTHGEYWPVKIKAIVLLGEAQDPKSVELLLSIFNDPFSNWECPSIKSYTATALGNYKGNPQVVDTLIKGINDRELLTREASIRSLGKIGDPKAVPLLLGLLEDPSAAVRLSVVKALEEIGDPRAIPHLERVSQSDGDAVVKKEALAALSNFHGSRGNN